MGLYRGRRIVTGHDSEGRSIVISDGPPENVVPNPSDPDRGHINFWKTETSPADNSVYLDPMAGPPCPLAPPKGGTMFRFFQIAPEKNEAGLSAAERDRRMAQMFEAAGAPEARLSMARHPSMHRTDSVDYIVVLKGEVTALLDVGEVKMKPFDVLIQRGTNHGWKNDSEEPALLVAVLVDADPLPR
ncbi:MAG TPA: cupin domain-containing protein [Micropepsaceae bacterium]|jgi:quercetin dioxygenase-like cupin family protein|nr:cupin domain-containing protein [Micropepsaceae bacterium]